MGGEREREDRLKKNVILERKKKKILFLIVLFGPKNPQKGFHK